MTRPRDPSDRLAIGGRRAAIEAIRAGRAASVLVVRGSRGTRGLDELLAEADRAGASVRWVDRRELETMGLRDHQGVAVLIPAIREMDERAMVGMEFGRDALAVVLDGITDPQNLGACGRAAEAAGASLLVARRRRAAPLSAAAVRASAGALTHLPVARVPNLTRAIGHLKDKGFSVVGLDHRAAMTIHRAPVPERPLALVVGSEDRGISRLVGEACDLMVAIPMAGRTGSLNAATALAVGLFGYALRPEL